MFERYTKKARQVIFFARYEASEFGSTKIESGHLLLALTRADKSLFNRFLRDASLAEVRQDITARLVIRERVSTSIDLPFSDESKRILAYAADEAEGLRSRHIGPEHLLLAMLWEQQSAAAQVLQARGLRLDMIRKELARTPMPEESPASSTEIRSVFSGLNNPALPKSGVVPDAETAKRIAEAVWIPLYGADIVANQQPLHVKTLEDAIEHLLLRRALPLQTCRCSRWKHLFFVS
jgi:ATP-dependent Clp protease ATP-binding subunit ClpA